MLNILGLEQGSEFWKSLNKYSDQKERLLKAVDEFIQWKNQYPFSGALPGKYPGFGSNDKKFKSFGSFGTRLPGIAHAHLTHNLSIVYIVDKETNTMRLYGVYSHDDIGTGSPPNINRQQQAGDRWARMTFDASKAQTGVEGPSEKDAGKFTPTPAGKVDYTPKKKPVPTAAQQTQKKIHDPVPEFVKVIDAAWPNQNFASRFNAASGLQDKLAVLNQEAHYIGRIQQKGRLYPNQMDYAKGLQILANYLVDLQRQKK